MNKPFKVPHYVPGWAKIGIHLIEKLKPEEQAKLVNVGDFVTRKTQYKYVMFKKLSSSTASGSRPLAMMYHRRRTSIDTKQLRIKHK